MIPKRASKKLLALLHARRRKSRSCVRSCTHSRQSTVSLLSTPTGGMDEKTWPISLSPREQQSDRCVASRGDLDGSSRRFGASQGRGRRLPSSTSCPLPNLQFPGRDISTYRIIPARNQARKNTSRANLRGVAHGIPTRHRLVDVFWLRSKRLY